MSLKIWKDKSGKWIDAKEFKERFAQGVDGVSALQQIKAQVLFSWITIIGLLCGVVVSIYRWNTLWWLIIVLLAGIGNTVIGLIGLLQKKKALAQIEVMMKGIDSQESSKSNLEEGTSISSATPDKYPENKMTTSIVTANDEHLASDGLEGSTKTLDISINKQKGGRQ